jgi:hypothetical protein
MGVFLNKQDIGWCDELDINGVVPMGTWAKLRVAGDDRLVSVMLKHCQEISPSPGKWKRWLLLRHGYLPLAKLPVGREWVRQQTFSPLIVSASRAEGAMPIGRINNGWLVAAMLPADRGVWSSRLGGPVVFTPAIPAEMNQMLPLL